MQDKTLEQIEARFPEQDAWAAIGPLVPVGADHPLAPRSRAILHAAARSGLHILAYDSRYRRPGAVWVLNELIAMAAPNVTILAAGETYLPAYTPDPIADPEPVARFRALPTGITPARVARAITHHRADILAVLDDHSATIQRPLLRQQITRTRPRVWAAVEAEDPEEALAYVTPPSIKPADVARRCILISADAKTETESRRRTQYLWLQGIQWPAPA